LITAVILCGGLATRLRGYVPPDLPKCLLQVRGKPILDHLFGWLHAHRVYDVILCVGHLEDRVRAHCERSVRWSRDPYPSCGVDVALRHAAPAVKTSTALVLNGDTLLDLDVAKFYLEYCFSVNRSVVAVNRDGVSSGAQMITVARLADEHPLADATRWVGAEFVDYGTPEALHA
jgi:choline kinase